MKLKIVTFIVIIVIAAVLRLWQLGAVPSSIDWDEAALGYNSYSILHTGKDEYGAVLPIVLRSFGDYKPALYSYLIMPFIPFFDLSALSVRLPSAIAGILAVVITYFLVEELFVSHKTTRNETRIYAEYLSLLTAFLLAISPWSIQFSRVAFEANVGLTLNLAGILFFLKGLKNQWLFTFSAICFGLSLYVYQSEKLFVPLIILVLLISFWRNIWSLSIKKTGAAVVVLFLVSLPMIMFVLTNKNALARAEGVSFLSQKTALLRNDITKLDYDNKQHDLLGLFLDNRRFVYTKTILASFLSHFDLNWLFFHGDMEARHHAPAMGLLYVFELPFLFIGLYCLFFCRQFHITRSSKLLLILWLLAAPIPASVTTGTPHAVRTINFLPTFQIFIAMGIVSSSYFIKKYQAANTTYKVVVFVFASCFLFLASLNFFYYFDQYFVQLNYYDAKDWQYGYKQLVDFVWPIHTQYKKIIVSDKGDFDQSYIFFLFYTKYDPKQYLIEGGTKTDGVEKAGNGFANFEFRTFNYYQKNETPLLLVGSPSDFPENFKKIHEIVYPDKTYAMYVVEKL